MSPRSHSLAVDTAAVGLVIENQMMSWSGDIGVPAFDSPTPMSATAFPSTETYTWAPRWSFSAIPSSMTLTVRGNVPVIEAGAYAPDRSGERASEGRPLVGSSLHGQAWGRGPTLWRRTGLGPRPGAAKPPAGNHED